MAEAVQRKKKNMSVESHKEKQLVIDEIKEKFEKSTSAVVIDYLGITVAQADAIAVVPDLGIPGQEPDILKVEKTATHVSATKVSWEISKFPFKKIRKLNLWLSRN